MKIRRCDMTANGIIFMYTNVSDRTTFNNEQNPSLLSGIDGHNTMTCVL